MIVPGLGHAVMVWLLRNSAGAAVVALLVLLAQWILGPRISARWRHNLWLLVIVRLVLPPLPTVKLPTIPHLALLRPLIRHLHQPAPAPVAIRPQIRRPVIVQSAAPTEDRTEPLVIAPQAPAEAISAPIADSPSLSALLDSLPVENAREAQAPTDRLVLLPLPPSGENRFAQARKSTLLRAKSLNAPPQVQPKRPVPWTSVLFDAWGAVALILLSKTLFGSMRVAIAVRSLRPVRDRALLELLHDCSRLMKLPRAPALLEGPHGSGPALVGFWRPRLLLPACVLDQFTWREVRHVVLHELVHLRRRDVLVNYVTSVALAVHWFNPLVWLAAARVRTERELACDEAVLALAPWREGRAYGSTIVKLLELLSRGAVPAGAMGVIGHKALMHRRIAMIARFDGSRRHWSASAILLSAAVTGAALAGAVRAQVQPAQEQPATVSERSADAPAQSDVKEVERKTADEPATEGKADAAPDEARAQQAVRAEAGRDEAPADQAPPPQPGNAPSVETNPQPHFPRYGPGAGVPGLAGSPQPLVGQGGPPQALAGQTAGAAPPGAGGPFMPRPGVNPASGFMQGAGPFGRGGGAPVAQLPGQPQIATIEDASAVKADAKTIEKLQRPMPIQVDGESLDDVLNMLAQKGGFDVLIDNRALGDVNVPQNATVTMNIREPQPIEQLLHFVLRQVGGDEVGFSVVHGVVMVSSRAELDRHVVTRVYDIRELGNPDDMQQTIDQTVGSNIGVRFVNGRMIVTTSEPNHREIAKLIAMLRQDGPHADATGGPAAETRVLQLKNIPAGAAAANARELKLGPGVRVQSDPRTNEVIITGPTGDEVRAASAVIEGLDSARPANTPPEGQPAQPANR